MKTPAQADIEALKARVGAGDWASLAPLARALDEAGKAGEATERLAEAANRGSAEARYLVGARLLVGLGAPSLPQDGVRLISESAGVSAGAAHLLGVLFALGAYVAQDWAKALQCLVASAELGSESAQQQLILLSPDRTLAAAASANRASKAIWRQLAETIDVALWVSPPQAETLNASPEVAAFRGLLPGEVCSWLIERSRMRLKRAQVYEGAAPRIDNYRSNTSSEFNLIECDFVVALCQVRIAAAAGVAFNRLEPLSVLHYAVGEQFADHYDFIDPRSPAAVQDVAKLGQRIITFITYLNDGYAGGETAFPRLGIAHKGARGDAVLFRNVGADGSPDLRTLHAGRPPTNGEKWIATQFIRGRPVIPGVVLPH